MENIKRIQYVRGLEEKRDSLERQLKMIQRNIKELKENCLHISVDLGYYGLYPKTGNSYCCLICGKGKEEEYFCDSRYIVHAENYLTNYDILDEKQRNEKFDHIQTLTLGLLRENPDMSREELVISLNNLIHQSILMREEQNKQKQITQKNKI